MKICTVAPHLSLDELVEVKNKSADEGQKLRLRAIINVHRGKRLIQVAEELLVSNKSVGAWLSAYNEKGVNGLITNKGGRPEGNPKWDTKIFTSLGEMIRVSGGYWSVPKMQAWIQTEFQKNIPEQTVWYHLNKLGFSYKSARPHPYKGDKERQMAFKKGVFRKSWGN